MYVSQVWPKRLQLSVSLKWSSKSLAWNSVGNMHSYKESIVIFHTFENSVHPSCFSLLYLLSHHYVETFSYQEHLCPLFYFYFYRAHIALMVTWALKYCILCIFTSKKKILFYSHNECRVCFFFFFYSKEHLFAFIFFFLPFCFHSLTLTFIIYCLFSVSFITNVIYHLLIFCLLCSL